MRLLCFNRLHLILRRPRSGRLEGWAAIPIYDSRYYQPERTSTGGNRHETRTPWGVVRHRQTRRIAAARFRAHGREQWLLGPVVPGIAGLRVDVAGGLSAVEQREARD